MLKKTIKSLLFVSVASILLCIPAINTYAFGNDLGISSLSATSTTVLEGQAVTFYTKISNNSAYDLKGVVKFYNPTIGQIGSDQITSVIHGNTDDVFVTWYPTKLGTFEIYSAVDPWNTTDDDPSNNNTSITITVLQDTDRDGITNADDDDDDGDGILDEEDPFPLSAGEWEDSDGDGTGNNSDPDDDNDGRIDEEDAFPLDPLEKEDTDEDGIGNNADEDDDNDGVLDIDEPELKTDPLNADTDGDSIKDGEDAFPLNPEEQYDYDKDGIGDNADEDDDNDGLLDLEDPNDHNKGPVIKINGPQSIVFLNKEFTLNGGDSFDEDGEIKEIQWTVNEKEILLGDTLNYTFPNEGEQKITIKVFDNDKEWRNQDLFVSVINIDTYLTGFLIIIVIFLAILNIFYYSSLAKKVLSKLIKK